MNFKFEYFFDHVQFEPIRTAVTSYINSISENLKSGDFDLLKASILWRV